MNHHRATRFLLPFFLALAVAAPAAAAPGTGSWYWPTGTEDFGGMSPWWAPRGGQWHLAQDMARPYGSAVYAIGSGTVLESKFVSGYGPGGSTGGAVVILHTTAAGKPFKALYGHLYDLRYAKGAKVAAGATIGRVNGSSPNHLHFGIHPGTAYPSDNNPYRGHTYTSSNTYGWVDPVLYLRTNPRIVPYSAPAVPVVLSLTTTSAPLSAGAASGYAYWFQSAAGTTTPVGWRAHLKTGVLSTISAEATVPVYDTKRYAVAVSATRPGLTVKNLMPFVRLSASDATPPWLRPSTLSGTVRNAKGEPFKGATVIIERRSGSGWVQVARPVSGVTGVFSAKVTPSSMSVLRARFEPPATYVTGASSTVTVTPHASLSRPVLSSSAPRVGVTVWARFDLAPRHSSTSKAYVISERLVSGRWVRMASNRARLAADGTLTKCAATLRFSARGTWRVRAYMPADGAHATSWSSSRGVEVR